MDPIMSALKKNFLPLTLHEPSRYLIKIQGQLSESWSANFGGMNITTIPIPGDGKATVLEGVIADQASLHGILNSICDLGLPLLKVEYLPAEEPDDQVECIKVNHTRID